MIASGGKFDAAIFGRAMLMECDKCACEMSPHVMTDECHCWKFTNKLTRLIDAIPWYSTSLSATSSTLSIAITVYCGKIKKTMGA